MKKKVILFTAIFALLLTLASMSKVLAITVDVSGNAAGSSSNVTVNQQNSTNYNQSNTSNINNNVNVDCNTGGNSASGNTGGNVGVNTGNCESKVNVTNCVNVNQINTGGLPICPKVSPTPKPSASPTPGQPGQPGVGGGAGGAGGGGNGGAGGGQALGEAGVMQDLSIFSAGMALVFLGLWQSRKVLAKAY